MLDFYLLERGGGNGVDSVCFMGIFLCGYVLFLVSRMIDFRDS